MTRGAVIIFLKAPVAGRVKTRLGAGVGMGRAAALFRILTERTIAEAMKSGRQVVLAVAPAREIGGFASLWPPRLKRIAQGSGSLGARMCGALAAAPAGPVVVIGADAPGFRARHVRAAFEKLRGADLVFGPADDGGYWLVGLARRRAAPDLFQGVRWSSEFALQDTMASAPADFTIARLETLVDIDEAADLPAIGPRSVA